jgi:hypothetical protein
VRRLFALAAEVVVHTLAELLLEQEALVVVVPEQLTVEQRQLEQQTLVAGVAVLATTPVHLAPELVVLG